MSGRSPMSASRSLAEHCELDRSIGYSGRMAPEGHAGFSPSRSTLLRRLMDLQVLARLMTLKCDGDLMSHGWTRNG